MKAMVYSVKFATSVAILWFSSLSSVVAQTYTATYLPYDVPPTTEAGQTGTNQCGTTSSQNSTCQNAYINSVDDFCLFAPPTVGPIGEMERVAVSYCTRSGYGTRLIPDGTIKGAHFVQTPDYIQITGVGDLTFLNIPRGDAGGEMDPHGADGYGNPIGGLVFGSSYGQLQQYHEWTNFMSWDTFCLRACKDGGTMARKYCEHIYDVLGCVWNIPANYTSGIFEDCDGDSTPPMGLYTTTLANGTVSTSTFYQGQPATPDPHPVAPSSNCQFVTTVTNQAAVPPSATLLPTSILSSISLSSAAAQSLANMTSVVSSPASSRSPTQTASPSGAVKDIQMGAISLYLVLVSSILLGALVVY